MSESQTSQKKPGGNTKTPGKSNQLYRWVFTLPAEKMSTTELHDILSQKAKDFVFSKETGAKTGYEHYQGCMSLIQKEYFNTVKNWIGDTAHIEPCKDWFASKQYCSKSDTHLEGPFTKNIKPLKTITVLRPWQKDLMNMVNKEPDDRTIIWYYDQQGGSGKTKMAKYLAYHKNATIITNGDVKDIACLLPESPTIVVFNFSRTKEDFLSYEAIESVKDGLITSAKYESKTKIFDSPHVIIFANFEPERKKLSADRWKVITL